MADVQMLQNLAQVTSFNQLTFDSNNQLTQRSGIGAFFRSIGDFFLGMSQAGRAEIAQRNEKILAALQNSVDAARNDSSEGAAQVSESLNSAMGRLREASSANKGAVLADMKSNMLKDPLFKALPESMKFQFEESLTHIANKAASDTGRPTSEWKAMMAAVKDAFLSLPQSEAFASRSELTQQTLGMALAKRVENFCNTLSDGDKASDLKGQLDLLKSNFLQKYTADYDMKGGMEAFKNDAIQHFLNPEQVGHISDDGIHSSFPKDVARQTIKEINGEPVEPQNAEQKCTEKLNEMLKGHEELKPFVSLMLSQGGMDNALAFLPEMSKISSFGDSHLLQAGMMPDMVQTTHGLNVKFDGDKIEITANFSRAYFHVDSDDQTPAIELVGTVTMTIDLNGPTTPHEVTCTDPNGVTDTKTVHVPQNITMSNGDCYFREV